MHLFTILALISMNILGTFAVIFSLKEDHLKKRLREQEEIAKRRIYEISVLRSIQERIGYSLDIERVIDILTGSLKNLFTYSTVSSIVLHENKVVLKTVLEERVGINFLNQVKKSMLASLTSLRNSPLPEHVEDVRTGLIADDTSTIPLASFFHIPLIVNGNVVGLISICSTKPGLYKDEEMTILYQLTASASNALSKLTEVISIEQEKLMAMITSLADGIVMIDDTLNLTFINQSGKDLLSISHLQNPTTFDVVSMLSKVTDFGKKIKDALLQKKIIEQKELCLGDKILQVIITPVLGAGEDTDPMRRRVMGATILIHDITLEKSLQTLKEDFTNAVVHELRSPLAAIKVAAEVIMAREDIPQSEKRLSTIIEEQSKRLLNDINSLLDAAKLEAGHFTLWKSPSDISSVVKEAIELFQPEAMKKQIHLDIQAEDSLPEAFIDPMRIGQVLNNLIANSLKFTPENGKISIKIVSQYNPQLPKTATNPGILLSVTDNGIGIPEDKQKNLFSKFQQIHQDKKTSETIFTESTGLGLYIAKGIIESHGGNMYAVSTPNKGTTIFFTLPVVETDAIIPLVNPRLQNVLEHYQPKAMN